nr:flagellar assembly protein FliW [Sedimentibacter sp.]
MNIQTRDFGELTVESDDIIKYTKGMYGFEKYKEFVILKDNPEDDIMYLQSIENRELSFVVIDPYSIMPGYEPKISDEDINELKVLDETKLKFLVIAIIKEKIQDSVVNLKSPIAINPDLKIARQVIVENLEYPLKYPIFNNREGYGC